MFTSWPVLIATAFPGEQPPCQLRKGCSLLHLDGNQEPVTISENDVTDASPEGTPVATSAVAGACLGLLEAQQEPDSFLTSPRGLRVPMYHLMQVSFLLILSFLL